MSKLIKECGNYTVVPASITHDRELNLKSRGMLLTLLSLPDNWDFSERGLVKIFDNEGRDSIHTTLKNLEELGYLKRVQGRGVDGVFGNIDYIVSDVRRPDFLTLNNENTVVGFSGHGENETTVAGFSVHGKSVAGLSDNGKSDPILKRNK